MHGRLWAFGLAFALAAAAADAETVKVGAEDDWLPYAGQVRGEVQGITVDLVRAAFARSGITVHYEVMPYARCMAQTRSGVLVACFNTLRNPSLEPHYYWHEPALFKVAYKIYARADSPEQNLRPKDLEGRSVAVTHNYEYGVEFDTNPKIKRVVTLRDESNFRMLVRGRVDFTVAPEFNTALLMARQPDLVGRFKVVGAIAPADVHMVFSRRHPDALRLLGLFESGLRELHASGRSKAIEAEWLRRFADPAPVR